MPKQGRDVNVLFSFYQQNDDGSQGDPLYLTTTGVTGGPKLTLAAWLKQYAEDADAVLELSTDDGLTIMDSPNDYQVLWHSPFADIDMVPGCYVMDMVSLINSSSRGDLGSFEVTIRPQVTEVP